MKVPVNIEKGAIIGLLAKRHLNGVSRAGQWWRDIVCWLGCCIFKFPTLPVSTSRLLQAVPDISALESPYHLVAVSGAHFTQGTILIVIIVSSGSAKSRTHQSAVGGFLVTRRGWPGRLRACRIWTFINSV